MATGRVHAILVATPLSHVLYERFYDATTEAARAEVREAFLKARSVIGRKAEEGECYAGHHRGGAVVFIPVGDVVFYALGSGDYDELALQEVLETVILALRDALSRAPSEALLLENYSTLCLTIDEVILEGVYHNSDKDTIRKATKMKVPWES